MKRALVTGITGFVGNYLMRELLNNGYEVYGTKRWRSSTVAISDKLNDIKLIECDLSDSWAVRKAFKAIEPEEVYHLAAQSYVDASYTNPAQTLESNIIGTTNIFESVREFCPNARVHFASSSEVFGQVKQEETPIKEDNQLRPASPYAVSKAACDLLAQYYIRAYDLKILITRSFTHTGPGRGEVFVESSFAKQIAEIEIGKRSVLRHGNLNSVRTWLDVRDIVKLFVKANNVCPPGVYVVGGRTTFSVGEMLEFLKSASIKHIETQQDMSRLRVSDVTMQIPDSSKIRALTGWEEEYRFDRTMKDLLDHWRTRV